ncbi:thermonuclease family protein [Streptomyces sp. NPDC058751]|uniref:thermonuclease family protein n=1 Tax=Streptomyces sp. NPDC058751 TaxID=3346623 RepID=UPI0036C93F33
MPMLLIKGSFKVSERAKPDGDTVPFVPDDPADWKLVPGCKRILPAADGHANIRLEGVDALETHYGGSYGPDQHQPIGLAHRAADELLKWLGFTGIVRGADETVTLTPAAVPGFILTRGTDVFGRCVALVGRGAPPGCTGYEIDVDEALVKKTANHHLLSLGLAYPTFYKGFPVRLRDVLATAARQARESTPPLGVWAEDVTRSGVKITGMTSLTADDGAVVLPKLFRRLKEYLDLDPMDPSLACFPSYLAGGADEFRIPPDTKRIIGLQNVVEITDGNTVRMTHQPEEIVFEEK